MRARAVEELGAVPSVLWLVETEPARDQLVALLGRSGRSTIGSRVWLWRDLWRAVQSEFGDEAPQLVPTAAMPVLLAEAIARTRRLNELEAIDKVVDFPGFRRLLADQIAHWTTAEVDIHGLCESDDREVAEQARIHRQYSKILAEIGCQDWPGMAVWGSRRFELDRSFTFLLATRRVVLLNPRSLYHARSRGLDGLATQAGSVLVTLAYDADPALAEAYAPTERTRQHFLTRGYVETYVESGDDRPAGLAAVERRLFREDTQKRDQCTETDGLLILGAPLGEGQALVVARRVLDLIEQGANPEEILIVYPRWNDQARVVAETLRGWGIETRTSAHDRLAVDPGAAALLQAAGLPGRRFEAAALVPLLRHGQAQRSLGGEARDVLGSVRCAALIQTMESANGLNAIEQRLKEQLDQANADQNGSRGIRRNRKQRDQIEVALGVLGRLATIVHQLDLVRNWDQHVARLRELALQLGLGSDHPPSARALEALFAALGDRGWAHQTLGQGATNWQWQAFVAQVEEVARVEPAPPPASSLRNQVNMLTIEEYLGVSASHLIAIDLTEGTFPDRSALEALLDRKSEDNATTEAAHEDITICPYASEMNRFLRLVGSAERSLTLTYPRVDEKGRSLLAAGFLDDLFRLFSEDARPGFPKPLKVLPPVLPVELAIARVERRVRAVAWATHSGETEELRRLATAAGHREPLMGTAYALLVSHARHGSRFNRYDGVFRDRLAIDRLRERFGADARYSASMLETYALCPHKFYLKYVLRVDVVDDRDALDTDYAERGTKAHKVLELVHNEIQQIEVADKATLLESFSLHIQPAIANVVSQRGLLGSDLDLGLAEIEAGQLGQMGERFITQVSAFNEKYRDSLLPRFAEWTFQGQGDGVAIGCELILGSGEQSIRLEGKVDRVDTAEDEGVIGFRVIDYKTGGIHGKPDLEAGLALQLPLYAMAFEAWMKKKYQNHRIIPLDYGYWALKDKGYNQVNKHNTQSDVDSIDAKEEAWSSMKDSIESFVLELADRLRGGSFPVFSRDDLCTRSCEFSKVCRVGQSRRSEKVWPELPLITIGESS